MSDNPILNNPYEEPKYYYDTDLEGNLDYSRVLIGRRPFSTNIGITPSRSAQSALFGGSDLDDGNDDPQACFINSIRAEVKAWREKGYGRVTRITRELLTYWFLNADRQIHMSLFFCQREAVETAIYLNEVADTDPNTGRYILNQLDERQRTMSADSRYVLPRTAFKMATGTGKTVVMAMLILYHYLNRRDNPQDTRFADRFLLVAPGITIRDRLGVLRLDDLTFDPRGRTDYYHQRQLIPPQFERLLGGLNACISIINYQALEPKQLAGKHASPLDGKTDPTTGKKRDAREDYGITLGRILKGMKGRRIIVINDEAHHCYLPKESTKGTSRQDSDENEQAMVWFEGLRQMKLRGYHIRHVYDLSATPYYLRGSGHEEYSLFPWVVSDFGLVDAIESGLVKIPFLPSFDNTHDLTGPKLRNIYENIKDELPKMGQRTKAKKEKEEGKKKTLTPELPPDLPTLLKLALAQFVRDYEDYEAGMREAAAETKNLLTAPPVLIVVCNNTSVSKEVFKYVAGYETTDSEGRVRGVEGRFPIFSNYDKDGLLRQPAPSLLIDSASLDAATDVVSDEFKRINAKEIDAFKREYATMKGAGNADKLTDADILREVVNTVGRPGRLGAHIRCVVSVSMLTEGWDANTVTHVCGIRAFGSQLLCEQVAGRALRRRHYDLAAYDRRTGEQIEEKNIKRYKSENIIYKFPPEYAHIIGVPFKTFKGGGSSTPPPQKPKTRIEALDDRSLYEIRFPNIVGYRIENAGQTVSANFAGRPQFRADLTQKAYWTGMQTAFASDVAMMEVARAQRDQEVIYELTRRLINAKFRGGADDRGERGVQFQLFGQLRDIVREWYETKLEVIGGDGTPELKRLIVHWNEKSVVEDIYAAIVGAQATDESIRAVLHYYNPEGSTAHVWGLTTRPVWPTQRSHVNYVVADTGSWEQIAAKTLDELPQVEAYVKNAFLGFAIPYIIGVETHPYQPDFIARVRTPDGRLVNLIIEISGFSDDARGHKDAKRYYTTHYWLPAANNLRDAQGRQRYGQWAFTEVTDISNIKAKLIQSINQL